jgi:voltage-gated potassium channel
MITTQTVAHACLSYLTTPMLSRFIREIEKQSAAWAEALIKELTPICAGCVPFVWTTRINRVKTPALAQALHNVDSQVSLAALMTSNRDRRESLKLLPLMLERAGHIILRPAPDLPLHNGDKIIWSGTRDAWNEQKLTANYGNALDYILTGKTHTGSWLGKYLNP